MAAPVSPRLHIGTSGFSYQGWIEAFYPADLPSAQWFEYYCQHFRSIELNSTFYHLPPDTVFEKWYDRSPVDFTFSIKASRYITHRRKLTDCHESIGLLYSRLACLKEKLAVVLFQLPPQLSKDIQILHDFLALLPSKIPAAFEFRHPSWLADDTYALLKKFHTTPVISDSESFPSASISDFLTKYIRLHGPAQTYASRYSSAQLHAWATHIRSWRQEGRTVFAYFNNDAQGYAVQNARELESLLADPSIPN